MGLQNEKCLLLETQVSLLKEKQLQVALSQDVEKLKKKVARNYDQVGILEERINSAVKDLYLIDQKRVRE